MQGLLHNVGSQPRDRHMPTLRVELFEGRTPEQKAELAKELTAACVRVLGGSPDAVDVLFFDVARQNWATGGVLWSDKQK
ncbi:4-oxalocrotonate tautomerase [Roseateles depolymerans]|uniref:4-oxalocrotonate tautomerase n=2 Tax=Roseateles depolymerans TaxID=76731 RepID=A0A0U3LKL7_9BURK|nr:4-oxalocrotonate tautomerase [Roseateles depolymerans]ALV08655.1 4-oxalocrotonate tautomerase [Roseateles depolymerans]REG21121.1 4-oxalocrotonate tautomerase [Roseateles depolymerans]